MSLKSCDELAPWDEAALKATAKQLPNGPPGLLPPRKKGRHPKGRLPSPEAAPQTAQILKGPSRGFI